MPTWFTADGQERHFSIGERFVYFVNGCFHGAEADADVIAQVPSQYPIKDDAGIIVNAGAVTVTPKKRGKDATTDHSG